MEMNLTPASGFLASQSVRPDQSPDEGVRREGQPGWFSSRWPTDCWRLSSREGVEATFSNILAMLRHIGPQAPGYAAGNILNLLLHLNSPLRDYDFSGLTVWQAYLQGMHVPDVNFMKLTYQGLYLPILWLYSCRGLQSERRDTGAGTFDGQIASGESPMASCSWPARVMLATSGRWPLAPMAVISPVASIPDSMRVG